MISKIEKKELEKIKPPKYREKVQIYLSENEHHFSLETIQKVYAGKRNNLIVAAAIITVFNNYMQDQKRIKSKMEKVIKQIKDTP